MSTLESIAEPESDTNTEPVETRPVLHACGIRKAFPGVLALNGAQLTLVAGEVHALMGENGAGKSTLIKVLAGAHQPDDGEIKLDGQAISIDSPTVAEDAGISVIYQEFNLVPLLTARENIFLGRECGRAGFVSASRERQIAREMFARLGADIDPDTRCADLSVAHQQLVEIAKALVLDARIIVMDEPTAALTDQEVQQLFEVIRDLSERGIAVVYVSHRLDEIYEISNAITVMRDGKHVATRATSDLSRRELIEMMVGRSIENEFPQRSHTQGDVLLSVQSLARESVVERASFELRRGEILALTGLVGAGRTELARLIFGADQSTAGSLSLDGQHLRIRSPRDAIRAGICLLTEDRKAQGLVLGHTVRENFGLPNLSSFANGGFVRGSAERRAFTEHIASMRIKVAGQEQLAKNLSGGNQQKVVLAKWLECDSRVLIFDEPTRGIDVGAKYEIYQLMNALVAKGKGIIMISSELPEVLGMADRILVMREGRIAGEISDVAGATQEDIMRLAVGDEGEA